MEKEKSTLGESTARVIERQLQRFDAADRRSLGERIQKHVLEVAERIRRFRETKGLDQSELAAACGFESHSIISRYEHAERVPDVISIFLMAEALDISSVDLVNTPAGYKGMLVDKLREAPAHVLKECYGVLIRGVAGGHDG